MTSLKKSFPKDCKCKLDEQSTSEESKSVSSDDFRRKRVPINKPKYNIPQTQPPATHGYRQKERPFGPFDTEKAKRKSTACLETPPYFKTPNVSYTQLLLTTPNLKETMNVENNKKLDTTMQLLYEPKKYGDHCGGFESDSLVTVSTQNLEMQSKSDNRPVERIKNTILPDLPKSPSICNKEKLIEKIKDEKEGAGIINWIFPIAKKFKEFQCTTKPEQTSQIETKSKSSSFEIKPKHLPDQSQEMIDSQHEPSTKQEQFNGPEWKVPCKHSFVAGVPRPYIGTCPPGIEKLAKFSKGRQKFFLTQDPRKKYCLTNPEVLRAKTFSEQKEYEILTNLVKDAENVCSEASSEKSSSTICDEIDLDNPLDLDLQGLNYWKTFANDEQHFLNVHTYRRVRRVMDRAKCKDEMKQVLEEERKAALISVPEYFFVKDRNSIIKTPTPIPSPRYAKLFRSEEKPHNIERLQNEKAEREERYKDAILRTQEKEAALENENKKIAAKAQERLVVTLAEEQFENAKESVKEQFQFSGPQINKKALHSKTTHVFPHTIREMKRLKREIKKVNLIEKQAAIIKKEFYKEKLDKDKYYPAAELKISEDSSQISNETSLSEQSSDDQDDIQVGKEGCSFKLRGFHYKMGKSIRGKKDLPKGHQKGCITREEWLNKLHRKKTQIKPTVEVGIHKFKDPNDKNLNLFYPKFDYHPIQFKKSAIREYVKKELGHHYERVLRKNLRIVHPQPRFNVKKFNLISFLEGHDSRNPITQQSSSTDQYAEKRKIIESIDFILQVEKKEEAAKLAAKKARMQLLGIPCLEKPEKPLLKRLCGGENRVQETDWAPRLEPINPSLERLQRIEGGKIPIRERWNMPAPKYRESTLRRNPRKPRKYSVERVPSKLFDEAVNTGKVPYIASLDHDKQIYENLRIPKRPYTEKFHTRLHHDHWNPTQDKQVDVRYIPSVSQPKVQEMKQKVKKIVLEHFQKAHPPCSAFLDKNLNLPNVDYDDIINAYLESKPERRSYGLIEEGICDANDILYHSLHDNYWENRTTFPGREKYLSFLNEIRKTLDEEIKVEEGDTFHETKLLVDKEEMIKSLEEDLKSIESCLMSQSSSEGTNLSNDSGSVILLNNKWKLPLDYVRKQDVPFEPLDRSRLKVEPINVAKENDNPYTLLPFSGQKRAQAQLIHCRDNFNTFTTRQNNAKRLRLEVPTENIKEKLVGPSKRLKFPIRVITDVDKTYVEDLAHKPLLETVNFKTGGTFIKDALRLKFESMVIQGQLVRSKIYDQINNENWEKAIVMKMLYEKLFHKWEKTEYEHSMAVVYQVKSYYETTDALRKEYREVERESLLLNMDIVFIEGHWIRCIMLQNFHYLLGDQDWRLENDWIHRVPGKNEDDIELESYDVSIANRTTANVRVREKDDAWAIKKYYEEVYEQNLHPVLIVFPDADSFLKGVENLKTNTFVLLLELHYILAINTELQDRLQSFESWCKEELKDKEDYVERKCSKKYFMEDRAKDLKRRVHDFLDKPVEETFTDEAFTKDRAVITEVWRYIIPESSRGSTNTEPKPRNMVAMISEMVMDTIAKFEGTNIKRIHEIEAEIRTQHARALKISKNAYLTEKRIETELKKVRRNLEPPFVKPKRVGKYVRQRLRVRKKPPPEKPKSISQNARFFYRAFHEEGEEMNIEEAQKNIFTVEKIQQQIVPFYFDHFLKMAGYTPNYNFRTQIEMRDGPEINFLKHRELYPELMEKMKAWENRRNRIMEENISRNPKMYENVK